MHEPDSVLNSRAIRRALLAAVWLAYAWAVMNCVYVYGFLAGARAYRVESAVWALMAVLAPLAVLGTGRGSAFEMSVTQRRWVVLLAVVSWLAMFAPLMRFPFLSDDYVFLELYRSPTSVLRTTEFFRP